MTAMTTGGQNSPFEVLWWKATAPTIIPTKPPMRAVTQSVLSLILSPQFDLATALSIPIAANPTRPVTSSHRRMFGTLSSAVGDMTTEGTATYYRPSWKEAGRYRQGTRSSTYENPFEVLDFFLPNSHGCLASEYEPISPIEGETLLVSLRHVENELPCARKVGD